MRICLINSPFCYTDHSGDSQRGIPHARRVADERGRAAYTRALCRYWWLHRSCLRRHHDPGPLVHPTYETCPVSGSVIRFPYLWAWQRERVETEGRKSRPVCMVLAIPKGNQTNLILLAISGTPIRSDGLGDSATRMPPGWNPRLESRVDHCFRVQS